MHYFGHTIDNGVKFLYFVRSLLPSKSPILTKYWWVPLLLATTCRGAGQDFAKIGDIGGSTRRI